MKYGDYFLEPDPDNGKLLSFNKGTLWLIRSETNKNALVIYVALT